MGPDRDETHDGPDELKYPSPNAEPADAGPFYHTNGQDRGPEHPEGLEDPDANKDPMVEHDQHQPDVHQTEDPSQQHASRPPNLEELQLAAQLGHGLAGTPMMQTDPNMNVDDPNLRNMLPPPEQEHDHHHQYIQEAPTAEMVAHGLPMNVQGPLQSHFMTDGIPPRKRSKVSRACDECRRKKIKCDATTDSGDTPCSSCARSSIRCLFSRVPQKRGPSKGYDTHLSMRIRPIQY